MGATFGAVVALAVSSVLTVRGGTSTGLEPTPAPPTRAAFEAPIGSCLDWSAVDSSDVHHIDCAQPHLFESVGSLSLADVFDPAAAFPAESAWLAIVQEKCTPLALTYLEGRYDPFGRFAVGALKPSEPAWRNGDRTLHCGLQVLARSGEVYRVQGGVFSHEQADVHVPGTCLAIDGVDVGDPVDCAQPHAVEVVGNVDFGVAFPQGAYPEEAKQDEVAGQACTKLAADYAGGPNVVSDKKLTVYWDTLRPESWRAGTRRVDCKLGALLPDKSGFAPVTGGVRGAVTIGTTPAPPLPRVAVPGAPVAGPPLLVATTPPPPPETPAGTPPPSTPGG